MSQKLLAEHMQSRLDDEKPHRVEDILNKVKFLSKTRKTNIRIMHEDPLREIVPTSRRTNSECP